MKSKITTTPVTNIADNRVQDNSKVEQSEHDSDMDVFTFYNVVKKRQWRGNLMHVSLYDDLIVRDDGSQHKILHMFSK